VARGRTVWSVAAERTFRACELIHEFTDERRPGEVFDVLLQTIAESQCDARGVVTRCRVRRASRDDTILSDLIAFEIQRHATLSGD